VPGYYDRQHRWPAAGLERRKAQAARNRGFMRTKSLITPVLIGATLLLAAALNPSPERHRDRIREAIGQRSPIARALGVGTLTAFASNYHSLGVASYTTAADRTVSVGALGMVFVLQ
jgi:hypothetical protein